MRQSDLPRVACLADRVHPALPEDVAVFEDRLALFPAGLKVLDGGGGSLVGYAVAHPVKGLVPPKLNTVLGSLPPDCDALLIHDVALAPEARGTGHAARVVEMLLSLASPYARSVLVSVYGTGPFWTRFGFHPCRTPPDVRSAYGNDATLMVRERQ